MRWLVVVVVSDDMLYMFTLKFNLAYTILMGVEIVCSARPYRWL